MVDDLGYPSVVGTGTRPDAATSLGRLCASGSSAASRVPGGACVPQPFRARPRDATPEISDGRETPTPVPGKRRRGLAAVVGLCSGHPTIRKAPIGRPIRRRVSLLFRAAPAPPRRSFRQATTSSCSTARATTAAAASALHRQLGLVGNGPLDVGLPRPRRRRLGNATPSRAHDPYLHRRNGTLR